MPGNKQAALLPQLLLRVKPHLDSIKVLLRDNGDRGEIHIKITVSITSGTMVIQKKKPKYDSAGVDVRKWSSCTHG